MDVRSGTRHPPLLFALSFLRLRTVAMQPLRYSINVTLDGCCDHRAGIVDGPFLGYAGGPLP